MNVHRTQSSSDAFGASCSGSLLGGTSAQNMRTRTDIDDISDLIEDVQALSVKVRSVVEAIIGGSCGGPECGNGKDCPSGVLSRIGGQSRDARTQIAMAADELERLARSFGV